MSKHAQARGDITNVKAGEQGGGTIVPSHGTKLSRLGKQHCCMQHEGLNFLQRNAIVVLSRIKLISKVIIILNVYAHGHSTVFVK